MRSHFLVSNYASFGNCFTFNSANNPNDVLGGNRVSSMPGPSFGLSLVINLEQTKYQSSGTEQVCIESLRFI